MDLLSDGIGLSSPYLYWNRFGFHALFGVHEDDFFLVAVASSRICGFEQLGDARLLGVFVC